MPLWISISVEFYIKLITERLCTLHTLANTKHIESHLEVIQGHVFWDHWKTEGESVLLCNNVDFRVENFEGKVWASPEFENPTVIRRLLSREPLRIFAQTLCF